MDKKILTVNFTASSIHPAALWGHGALQLFFAVSTRDFGV